MHITVHCPHCNTRYQLDPQLRGQRMRCPNKVCRTTFVVMETSDPPPGGAAAPPRSTPETGPAYAVQGDISRPPPTRAPRRPAPGTQPSGAVGDLVPILRAESTTPADQALPPPPIAADEPLGPERGTEPRVEVRSWELPPPVRRSTARTDALAAQPPPVSPLAPPPEADAPAGAENAEPPPSATAVAPPEPTPLGEPAVPVLADQFDFASQRRRTGRLLLGLVLGTVFLGGAVWYVLHRTGRESEEQRYEQALRDYTEGRFASAEKAFYDLEADSSLSPRLELYGFLGDLSQLRDQAVNLETDPLALAERLKLFVDKHRPKALLKQQYRGDVGQTWLQTAQRLLDRADRETDSTVLARAEEAYEYAREYTAQGKPSDREIRDLQQRLSAVKKDFEGRQRLKELLAEGDQLLAGQPNADAVRAWRQRAEQLGFKDQPPVVELGRKLDERARSFVVYVPADRTELDPPLPPPAEPSLQVLPRIDGPALQPDPKGPLTLALVRGVLYALDQQSGSGRWALRVGIDTTNLPVRLPPTPTTEELLLVVIVSGQTQTLQAVVAQTGTVRWQFPLGDACLGRPLVVGERAYVPTYQGKVHVLEIYQGKWLGYFDLRQPLTVGGAWQEGTDLLYFPADSQNVYVLHRTRNQCVAILRSGHPTGSLRSEPVVVPRTDPLAREASYPDGYLILPLADGLEHMKLAVYELPITTQDVPPALRPEPRIPGWSWFQPYWDREKLALVTDAGGLGLFGINQVRNRDRQLFPLLPAKESLDSGAAPLGRAQVVAATEDQFWINARGQLQKWTLNLFRQELKPAWDRPQPLGSALHPAQTDAAHETLFCVTQSDSPRACLATAVEARTGAIRWQRQVGLDCAAEPLVLGPEVLALDRSGSLLAFDPPATQPLPDWQDGGRLVAGPLPRGPVPPILLPGETPTVAYALACLGDGRQLRVRRYEAGKEITEWDRELPKPLAGTPALLGDRLVLPLSDGKLWLVPLTPQGGPAILEWRDSKADPAAVGHALVLDAATFVVTDGRRGLRRFRIDEGQPREAGSVELQARLVAPPVRLAQGSGAGLLAVADHDGNVTLLTADTLQSVRVWSLDGTIVSGPFVRGSQLGCVVKRREGGRSLVWLDPARDQPLWEFPVPGQGVVGQPQLIGNTLVLADQSGKFYGLDPATGKERGPAVTLQATAAPATAPVPFGPGRAFVPLTDGTVFILSLAAWDIKSSFRPIVW